MSGMGNMLSCLFLFFCSFSNPDKDNQCKSAGIGLSVKEKLNQGMEEEEDFRDFTYFTILF